MLTGMCSCPAGKYASAEDTCTDCPKASFCEGGTYALRPSLAPVKQSCPDAMTTLGQRGASSRACVNTPGTSYSINTATGVVAAVECPVNTYSSGLRRQRACLPCPPNFGTDGQTGCKSGSACVVPPGYYLKAPGISAPCSQGQYKAGSGNAGNCTQCAFGVTTAREGSTSAAACQVLQPGFYATAIGVDGAITAFACPQGYVCAGGVPLSAFNATGDAVARQADTTITRCPDGMWTEEMGATSLRQCLVPPGHFTAGGVTQICPDGSYRADWLPATLASSCLSCGRNVRGDKSDEVTVYNSTTGAATLLAVQTSPEDCYVQPGQGLFYSSVSSSFRAVNCEGNSWGTAVRLYGLNPYPCRPCPTGFITSSNATTYPNSSAWSVDNGDGTGGFTNRLACVHRPGWGLEGTASRPCAYGSFNPGDSYGPCTPCGTGLTTQGSGAGVTAADCGLAPGFGYYGGTVALCPAGTFNAASWTANATAPCTPCAGNTTTTVTGATSAALCNLCLAGWGGAGCATQCGGGTGAAASYGPAGRAVDTACLACPAASGNFTFNLNGTDLPYSPPLAAPAGAQLSLDCLAEFAQIVQDAWWLPTTDNSSTTIVLGVATFEECVALCNASVACQYVTFDYEAGACYVRSPDTASLEVGDPWIGFKTAQSSQVGVASLRPASARASSSSSSIVRAKVAASGQFSWYHDRAAAEVGTQVAPAGAGSFTSIQQCLDAADDDVNAAGVLLTPASPPSDTPKSCRLVYGDATPGLPKRSVTRADPGRFAVPSI